MEAEAFLTHDMTDTVPVELTKHHNDPVDRIKAVYIPHDPSHHAPVAVTSHPCSRHYHHGSSQMGFTAPEGSSDWRRESVGRK